VQLVDKEDDLTFAALDLLDTGLEPLLELAAEAGAGDERAQVERQDALVLERLGDVARAQGDLTAARAAYRAGQVFGGYGFSREYRVERLYRDARVLTLYEGTSEIQRLVIARKLLK